MTRSPRSISTSTSTAPRCDLTPDGGLQQRRPCGANGAPHGGSCGRARRLVREHPQQAGADLIDALLPASAAGLFELLSPSPPGWGGNLLRGLVNSVQIALGAYSVGIVIGTAGAYGKLYGGPVVRDLLEVYTTLVRAVPELVLILLLYFAGTDLINRALTAIGYAPVDISGLVAGIVVLGFVQGAYSTEVLRGAILAVPQGQIEAARAYGMPPGLLLRRITLPAMLPFAIPGLANLWLIATKDTALLAVVGFSELTLETRQAAGDDQGLFHLLHRSGRDLPDADAVFQLSSSRASSAGRGAACHPWQRAADVSELAAQRDGARSASSAGCSRTASC